VRGAECEGGRNGSAWEEWGVADAADEDSGCLHDGVSSGEGMRQTVPSISAASSVYQALEGEGVPRFHPGQVSTGVTPLLFLT